MREASRRCVEPVPRDRWAEHPRFPAQALLLGSHQNFRRISKALVAASPKDGGPSTGELGGASLAARQGLFDRWQWAMRSHEHYEEHKLYPFLRHRFRAKTAPLEDGHRVLHAMEDDLRQAVDTRDEASWAIRIARYDVLLHEHLRDEEDLVIPCLLALEPREFSQYYYGSLAKVIAASAPCAC